MPTTEVPTYKARTPRHAMDSNRCRCGLLHTPVDSMTRCVHPCPLSQPRIVSRSAVLVAKARVSLLDRSLSTVWFRLPCAGSMAELISQSARRDDVHGSERELAKLHRGGQVLSFVQRRLPEQVPILRPVLTGVSFRGKRRSPLLSCGRIHGSQARA